MDRKLWKKSYTSFPRFPCPRCSKGHFKLRANSVVQLQPQHVTNALDESELYDEASYGRFSCFLECDFTFCQEIVAVAGDYSEHYHHHFDEDINDSVTITDRNFSPFIMRPAPVMISTPEKLNDDSKKHLVKAYELFWADWASCANRLRIVTEYLLDQLAIPRTGVKGKRKNARLDLSDRIDLLKVAQPGHDQLLNALRVVGNLGSHDGIVDFDALLDCFEFLEEAMSELIDQRRAKMDARAAALVQNRGKSKP